MKLNKFTEAYVNAGLLSIALKGIGGKDIINLNIIEPATLAKMVDDCNIFQKENTIPEFGHGIFCDDEIAGAAFWHSRNDLGGGFQSFYVVDHSKTTSLDASAQSFGPFHLVLEKGKIVDKK